MGASNAAMDGKASDQLIIKIIAVLFSISNLIVLVLYFIPIRKSPGIVMAYKVIGYLGNTPHGRVNLILS